ncbi:hypothetical protein BJX63DRAFT_438037 [Aspergillus granulosus]|uniref:J domain-containing protein n=1 Tax=Aspergillus granulosus TaxID=176169 RepID=A0ABR4GT62_9EURO
MDCYQILGISREANNRHINSAYKSLALKHHLTKQEITVALASNFNEYLLHPHVLSSFCRKHGLLTYQSQIQQAVEILRDPIARKAHDQQLPPSPIEERLFACPDYHGWVSAGLHARDLSRSARYMYSYGHSVHMDPHSKESQEELERCARARREEEDIVKAEGAKPKGMDHAKFEGESVADSDLAGGDGEDAEIKVESDDEVERANIANVIEVNYSADMSPDAESKREPDVDFESDNHGDVKETKGSADVSEADADLESKKSPIKPVSEDGSMIKFELGPEYRAEFDANAIIAEVEAEPGGFNNVDSSTTGHAIFDAEDPESITTDRHAASLRSPPNLAPSPYMMSGSLDYPNSESQVDADKAFVTQTKYGSDSSAYYKFSEPASSASRDIENQSLKPPPTAQTHNFRFNDTNIYPHLRPFISYFATKLANKDGRYTKDDFQVELQGMVMETYCGWLETVRSTIPGAESLETKLDPIRQDCLHLGYWEKKFGCEECEECHLWRPIYTLVCPGCGIRKAWDFRKSVFVFDLFSFGMVRRWFD